MTTVWKQSISGGKRAKTHDEAVLKGRMMRVTTRRAFLGAAGSSMLMAAACGNGVGSGAGAQIDARVDVTRDFLFSTYPGTRDLAQQAFGVLYMPLVTEAGFFFGGAYGRGALRINDVTVDYYSTTKATYGLQIGAQQYAHALFFMTEAALADFRSSPGWAVGADLRYATPDKGGASIGKESIELDPVIALVFGQSGLIAGATLSGTKYTRILP
jgi:lipid-binding SYLF domain-containing protein